MGWSACFWPVVSAFPGLRAVLVWGRRSIGGHPYGPCSRCAGERALYLCRCSGGLPSCRLLGRAYPCRYAVAPPHHVIRDVFGGAGCAHRLRLCRSPRLLHSGVAKGPLEWPKPRQSPGVGKCLPHFFRDVSHWQVSNGRIAHICGKQLCAPTELVSVCSSQVVSQEVHPRPFFRLHGAAYGVCPCCTDGSVRCDRLEASVFTPLPGQATRYPFGAEHVQRFMQPSSIVAGAGENPPSDKP